MEEKDPATVNEEEIDLYYKRLGIPRPTDEDPLEGATEEERKGVEAIQFLLGLDQRKEPLEVSLNNWRGFMDSEKRTTMSVYKLFSAPKEG